MFIYCGKRRHCFQYRSFAKPRSRACLLYTSQGVAIAAAISRDIPIFEYAPLKIKMSITGNGRAAKEQVAYMLQKILHIPDENMLTPLDATDGLAAALCHFYQSDIGCLLYTSRCV